MNVRVFRVEGLIAVLLMSSVALSAHATEPATPGSSEFDLADRLAIQNVVASAFINLDSFNLDAWSNSFTDDATFVAVDAGNPAELTKEQVDRFMRARFRRFEDQKMQRRHV